MRMGDKGNMATNGANQLLHVSFHDFVSKEDLTSMELASEFGISLKDVKNLKKHLGRS